ncbi:MAG: Calx-beta domain-containing protein [Isosphaeraceae bacterium]
MKAARSRRRRGDRRVGWVSRRPLLEVMERRELLATFVVTNASDSGAGSLRQAILDANANALISPGRDSIVFAIPASTAPNLDVAVPGFDPATQTWTIRPLTPLPVISDSVLIDGFTQAHTGVPFRYPNQLTNTVQTVSLVGSPTGGTFTLSTVAPLPVGTTAPIPFDASSATVLAALIPILGVGNVFIEGGPAPGSPFTITLIGAYARQDFPALVGTSSLTGGTSPSVDVTRTTQGGVATADPVTITSSPSTTVAITGNDAHNRVVIDGSAAGGTGFVLDTTNSILRGLVIANFQRGVDIPAASDVGNRVQGNFIGSYVLYPVDPQTGDPLTGLAAQRFVAGGNASQGIRIAGTNSYVGGTTAQEANVIAGNGAEGISLLTTALGSQVYNNQVGVIGPTALGYFYTDANGGDGLLVASSSNLIGAAGAGNIFSGNAGAGVHLAGAGSTRNVLVANYIGAPPGGGLELGQGNTGNQGDGVWIDGSSDNRLGGSAEAQRNVISRNGRDGVRIEGASAVRNVLVNNYIGVDSSGATILGNAGNGVGIYSGQNTVGPNNVITANLRGVLISGATAVGNRVAGNKIGTDSTGNIDLGNAIEGVRIDSGASGNTINGDGSGSQVISGNNLGIAIVGAGSSNNVVQGNYIGVNAGGDSDDDNSVQGILIDDAARNLIGGAGSNLRNVISANLYGVEIRNLGATSNTIQGNYIGTDAAGTSRLGSELDGIFIHLGASSNTIGGNSTDAGNRIAFNIRDGVRIEDNSVGNALLTNAIFDNVGLGIDLVTPVGPGPGPNHLQAAPALTSALIGVGSTTIVGTLNSAPNATFSLQFFLNNSVDPLGRSQGEQFLGVGSVTTDGAGFASFTITLSGAATVGQYLTATAMSAAGDTSMFSLAQVVTLATPKFVVSNTNDSGPGSLRQAILDANATAGTDTILFRIPASLSADLRTPVPGFDPVTQTWRIQVLSALPVITEAIILDGYNQANTGVPFRYPSQANTDPAIDVVSKPNTLAATIGNDARVRIVVDGSFAPGATGFVIDTSNSLLRGLAIANFRIGVSIPNATDVGNRIQGNYIGSYMVYPVDARTGTALSGSSSQQIVAAGNQWQGVVVGGTNTVIGGTTPQEGNVIAGNGAQGIWIPPSVVSPPPDVPGNQVYGNQIGLAGAPTGGFYFVAPNGAEGILIESSSNAVGGQGAGNLISGNVGAGIHIRGAAATKNRIQGNYIGAPPGGALLLGVGNTGNRAQGVWIENASDNLVGGADDALRNVIARNLREGVRIEGASGIRNLILNNYIGIDAAGTGILGNSGDGVAIYSPGNTVGPNNVISANNRGILISGPSASGNIIQANRIGTDSAGKLDLGNALEGIRIELGATGTQVRGDGLGSQVISGNNVGLAIVGASTTATLVVGNYIGTDLTGTADLGNSLEGIQLDASPNNTIGGTASGQRNLISANHWGIVISNPTATGNVVQANFIGTDSNGLKSLGNELDGVWILLGASFNTIGGPIRTPGAGNIIGFNVRDGVRVENNSVANVVLTNSIFQNGGLGIDLVGPLANDGAVPPTLTSVASSLSFTRVKGTLAGSPNATYTLQFFANVAAGETGGQRFLGQSVVAADASGAVNFIADVAGLILPGQYVTATATSAIGDTSRFAASITESYGLVQFNPASYSVLESAGTATITVRRSGGSGGYFTVNYATAAGTAEPFVNYTPVSGTLVFPIDVDKATFTVPIVNNSTPGTSVYLGLVLANPVGAISVGSPSTATVTILGTQGSSSLVVTNTNDSGPGSLRQAILNANASPGPDVITFRINASNATNLNVPVAGFDPVTQTWAIQLTSPLPAITDPVRIDGLSQGASPVLYRYPSQLTTAVQTITLTGGPTGGSFTLTRPDTGQETLAIPYNATAATVQSRIRQIFPNVGEGITVSGGPAPVNPFAVTFGGTLAGQAIPTLLASSFLTGGTSPAVEVVTTTEGGNTVGSPVQITSSANSLASTLGNNAALRVALDGSRIDRGAYPNPVGLAINTSQSLVAGLMIWGFDVGIAIAGAGFTGNRIQGNAIGAALLTIVNSQTGSALPGATGLFLKNTGNTSWGISLAATNATIGGADASEANLIAGNALGGVWIQPGATGNQVLGNQVGLIGPGTAGLFAYAPNGGDGILVQASSNTIGGALAGSGNLIASNRGNGLTIRGADATRNRVLGNVIGLSPASGSSIAIGSAGNLGDGIAIQDGSSNTIGGDGDTLRNVVSGNFRAGVRVSGLSATGNLIANNIIGLDTAGGSIRGNGQEGVALLGPGTTVGPNNVISGNRQGVAISGPSASGNRVVGNKIGTNLAGTADLGNAFEGVRIDNGAQNNTVQGDGQGSQVISGNNNGVAIVGNATAFNAIVGNYIGTDATGTADLANALQGVLIDSAPANTVGGPSAALRNLISANHWGVEIVNPGATYNSVQGNFIGTNAAGTGPLGNELDGVWILLGASSNTIGGASPSQGNRIAYNIRDGVRIENDSVGNAILSNAIASNGGLGIDLVSPPGRPNNLQPAPVLTAVASSLTFTRIQGTQAGSPNTSYTIQFFTTASTGSVQGQAYLGQAVVKTDASGFAAFSADVPVSIGAGQAVTATATDPFGNTSQFSPAISEVMGVTEFSLAGYTVGQDGGSATITVVRLGGSGGYFSVDYATIGGTAQPGVDYSPVSGTLVFQAGINSLAFNVPILNSGLPGATLTVLLGLSNPVGAASLGSPSRATLSILNANQPGIASFSSTTFVTMANSGSATVTVVRSSGGSTVSVQYATMNGTAKAGLNYVATSGTLTFGPGETSKTFAVPILFDPKMGSQVSLGLNLSNPTGGLGIGPPNPATLTIQYVTSPRVTKLQLIAGGGGISGILVSYSEALDPSRAVDPRNYGYTVRTPGRDGKLGTRDDVLVGIQSYRYDPAKQAVTLGLSRAVAKGTPIRITINQVTDVASAGVGVANLQGTLLQGSKNPGLPGGIFVGDVKGKAVIVPAGPGTLVRKAKRAARG